MDGQFTIIPCPFFYGFVFCFYLFIYLFFAKFCLLDSQDKQFENKSRGHVTIAMSTFGTEQCRVIESINFLSNFYNLRYIYPSRMFSNTREGYVLETLCERLNSLQVCLELSGHNKLGWSPILTFYDQRATDRQLSLNILGRQRTIQSLIQLGQITNSGAIL